MDLNSLTIENIQNFISNLGFPIFMSLYFMYAQQKASSRHDRLIEELECVKSQLLETKLQVGQSIQDPQIEKKEVPK